MFLGVGTISQCPRVATKLLKSHVLAWHIAGRRVVHTLGRGANLCLCNTRCAELPALGFVCRAPPHSTEKYMFEDLDAVETRSIG